MTVVETVTIWDDKMWTKMGEYHAKLALQREQKKERKVKAASSSSSFSGFSPSMPVLLCQLSTSYDNIIVTSVAFSSSFAVTFATSSLIISAEPFVPPSVDVIGELSHKQQREDSALFVTLKLEMWAEFKELEAARSRQLSLIIH